MAGKHPSYCLCQLLALTNATRTFSNEERVSSLDRDDTDNKDAAVSILNRLKSKHAQTVSEMAKVADAYINLFEMNSKDNDGKREINISKRYFL